MTINDSAAFAFAFEGYKIADEADKAGDATIKYYGYLNKSGNWYIMERDVTNKTYRYKKGDSAYRSLYWGQREALTYEDFNDTFK